MPPKIDKSHGFMQSIIKNQVLRDEYDKEQKNLAHTKETEALKKVSSLEETKSKRTPRRAAQQLYVPPHVKKNDTNEPPKPSLKNIPEKRSTKEFSPDKKDLKRPRQNVLHCESSPRTLFKFEYEDDSGDVRTLYVKEDDNAEDLAETFGNQLGLTKSLKKALQHKLREEINSCLSGP